MTGFTDYSARKTLDHWTGKTSLGTHPNVYLGLFTAMPTDAGGGTEVSGNAYARVLTASGDWNAAAASAPSSTSNSASEAFPAATPGSWGTVVGVGAWDAPSSGNLLWYDYLGNFAWHPVTVSSASPGVVTDPAHGYSNGDSVVWSTEFGGATPSFSASNFTGTLTVANVTTDTYTLQNSAVDVNTSSKGNGCIRKVTTQSVVAGVVVSFAGGTPGDLQFYLA